MLFRSADGSIQGARFLVNSTWDDTQSYAAIDSVDGGGFVVVWESANTDGSGWGVYGQRYGADASSQGGEFLINTTTSSDQREPAVAGLSGGGFVVTWISAGQDGSSNGIYAQRFNNAGMAQGSEFLVNSATSGQQDVPNVLALTTGGFVISWASNDSIDGSGWGVFAQEYDAAGNTVNDQF